VEPVVWFITKLVLISAAIAFFAYALASYKGIPITLIILGVLVLVYSVVMNRTVFGRHIYAIGGNRHAAELSGIKTRRVDFWLFVNMGFLAALAGLIFTARLNLAGPKAGDGFELEAISAAFIGGAAVQGGVGTIGGAIIGGLIIGVLNNGMSILGIGIEWQQAVKGMVLLLAVAFDVYNKRRSGGS
jgi:putative multiple sugar transport system permease protein